MSSSLADIAGPFAALIVLIFVGMWAKHRGIITVAGQTDLTRLILSICLPALVFASTATEMTRDMLLQTPLVILAGMFLPVLGYSIARLCAPLLKLEPRARIIFELEAAFANTGFLGIPVNALLFGARGALLAILFDFGLTVLFYSLSVWILDREQIKSNWAQAFANPLTAGLLLGLIPALAGRKLPALLIEPPRLLGQVSIPLGLLLVGAMAVPISWRREQSRVIGGVGFLRLLIIPLLIWALVRLLHAPEPLASVLVLESAMPAFASGPILAQRYGGDHQLAASTTVFTTLLAIFTLPLFAILLTI